MYGESGPLACLTLDVDPAVVFANDTMHHAQTKTGAALFPPCGEKWIKNVAQMLARNARAVVLHANHYVAILSLGAELNVHTPVGHLRGVLDEIDDHLFDLRGIQRRRRQRRIQVERDHEPRLADITARQLGGAADDLVHIMRPAL